MDLDRKLSTYFSKDWGCGRRRVSGALEGAGLCAAPRPQRRPPAALQCPPSPAGGQCSSA